MYVIVTEERADSLVFILAIKLTWFTYKTISVMSSGLLLLTSLSTGAQATHFALAPFTFTGTHQKDYADRRGSGKGRTSRADHNLYPF